MVGRGGSAEFYDAAYSTQPDLVPDPRYPLQRAEVGEVLSRLDLSDSACVVEIGAGFGYLRDIHPNYIGIEQSTAAVERGRELYGGGVELRLGDATALDLPDASVDFLFSLAVLEHVPEVYLAFTEIVRVLKPGGWAFLHPAWNCRPWTVKKLQQWPYRALPLRDKVGKFLIPLRENLAFRFAHTLPRRLWREARLALRGKVPLEWRPLNPDFSSTRRDSAGNLLTSGGFPHMPDEDAFVSMDPHSALAWFAGRDFEILSHPTVLSRLLAKSEGILVRKPGP